MGHGMDFHGEYNEYTYTSIHGVMHSRWDLAAMPTYLKVISSGHEVYESL